MFPGNDWELENRKALLYYLIEATVADMQAHKTRRKLYDFRELRLGMRDLRTTQNY